MKEELRHLREVERPAIIKAISTARDFGDLSENAEYHTAKEKQGYIEAMISLLESKLSRVEIIDPIKKASQNTVSIGATVTLRDDEETESVYILVGEYESNPDENKISIFTPVARAMMGKRVGDDVVITLKHSSKHYEITKIEYREIS